tara:strand:+ start:559 stop:732 length:174 start_codon:yes stop_codon:yes gene_type:complete
MNEVIISDFKKEDGINKLFCKVSVIVNTNGDDNVEAELAGQQLKTQLLGILKLAKND